jgi:thiamine pyrophosphate-dependent acetolactate synthase large subunit-like protein
LSSSSTTAPTARSACIRSVEYPGRVIGTDPAQSDFAALARAYGGHGETVARTDEFAPAFERARASGKPAIHRSEARPGSDHADADADGRSASGGGPALST